MDNTVSKDELQAVLAQLNMNVDDPELYRLIIGANLEVTALVDAIELPTPEIPERKWWRPEPEDNALGAWYVRTDIHGASGGKLAGRTIVLKDTVLLAGVPLMAGTSILEGYMPEEDAEIVHRLLNAGVTIIGKSVCEAYCFSGGSHTSATGPVHNPHKPAHTSGGSSSGSGALVAAGKVDMAIGCDQGGSIRMPSSYCGLVGMKPTFGLVPYTGILGMNPNIDHTGPMTRTVADNALLLEVLAGPDGVDSRQAGLQMGDYTGAVGGGVSGLRIGLVKEGFEQDGGDSQVNEKVRTACARMASLGATVTELSIPMHKLGAGVTFAGIQAMMESMFQLDGCVLERPDVTPEGYLKAQAGWRQRTDELPHNVKIGMLTAQVLKNRYGTTYVSRAMARLPLVRAAYDDALREVDILVMPTTPTTAPLLPPENADAATVFAASVAPLANTAVFNHTHHPALTVPCGMVDGLPAGLMMIGKHWDEATLYRAAGALEQSQDWRQV